MQPSGLTAAVLWDVDGTLVDTAELHYRSWCVLADELGATYTRDQFNATFGWRNPEIIPLVFGNHYTEAEVLALGDRKEALYRAEARNGVALLPGVRKLIEALAAAGIRQGIGSSAPRQNIDLILQMAGVGGFIEAIVAMEDTRRGKPDPQVFLMGAERLGIDPRRCIVIEDAPVGVQAAKAGGMRAVAVTCVGHHPAQKLRDAGADLVVHSLEELTPERMMVLLGRITWPT